MMKISRMMGILALCASAALSACDPGSSGGDDDAPYEADVAHGAALVEAGQCKTCHAPDLAGSAEVIPGTMVYSSNITPDDATGVGLWTDLELDQVLRLGKSRSSGEAICDPMPVYANLSDEETADIIAYLRSVPPVNRQVMDSVCHQ
jgi:mono/diheme cytochrome c family protein